VTLEFAYCPINKYEEWSEWIDYMLSEVESE